MDDLCSAALRHLVGRQALVFGNLIRKLSLATQAVANPGHVGG
jgi:hypothetical protein